MANPEHGRSRYVEIWALLLAAMVLSLAIGALGHSTMAVALIFLLAIGKALLVLAYFMHLRFEPRWVPALLCGAVLVLVVLVAGLAPDVVFRPGGLDVAVAAPRPHEPVTEAETRGPDAGRGRHVYEAHCAACHQTDGRGLAGKLAASFVDDRSRLEKSDEQLLASIRDGMRGAIGVMPPWGQALTEQQRSDALAYIRATFGGER